MRPAGSTSTFNSSPTLKPASSRARAGMVTWCLRETLVYPRRRRFFTVAIRVKNTGYAHVCKRPRVASPCRTGRAREAPEEVAAVSARASRSPRPRQSGSRGAEAELQRNAPVCSRGRRPHRSRSGLRGTAGSGVEAKGPASAFGRPPRPLLQLPGCVRGALRSPARPLRVLDPRRGLPDSGARGSGRRARDAGGFAYRPRVARRRGAALPGGDEAGRQAAHRLRGLRRGRQKSPAKGLRAPDAARRVERRLLEPDQARLGGLPRGLLLQASRRLGAALKPRRRARCALRLPLGARREGDGGEPAERRGGRPRPARADLRAWRSEEHTSELQSHSDLVC